MSNIENSTALSLRVIYYLRECTLLQRSILSILFCLSMCILLLVTTSAADAGKKAAFIVGGELDYPPYSILDERGQPSGFNSELTRAIATDMGLDIEVKLGPWGEVRQALEKGDIDIIQGMFYSDDRAKTFDFSPPFKIVSHSIFTRKAQYDIRSLENIRNKKIIVMRGDIMHDYALKHRLSDKLLFAATPAEALSMLSSGKGDCALLAKLPAIYWIKKLKLENIASVGQPIESLKYCYAVRKGNTALLSQFSEGLLMVHETGEFDKLNNKWLSVLEQGRMPTKELVRYAIAVVILLLLLAITSFIWSIMLRRKVKQRTSELQESRDQWEYTFDSIADPIMILDNNFRILKVNRSMSAALGISPSSAEGLICYASVHGTNEPPEFCPHVKLLQDGLHHTSEVFEPRIGGHFLISVSPLFDANGILTGSIHAARNITEIKQAEGKLQKTLDKINTLVQSSPAAIITINTEGIVTQWNKAAEQIFGWTDGEVLGKQNPIVPDAKQDEFRDFSKKAVGGKSILNIETWRQKKDGSRVEVNLSIIPLIDATGIVYGAMAFILDVTDRNRMEDKVRKNEEKLRNITSALGEGLYVMDSNGMIKFMNFEAERLLGWTMEELKGRNFHDIIHNRRADNTALLFEDCPIHNALKTGEKFTSRDEVFVRKDGSVFPVSVISTPIMENGDIASSVTAFRDISERKQLEQEREKLIDELQKALAEIKTLHGILPICSICKKIRDDRGAWTQMESYISNHTDAYFSHGYCPDCGKKALEEIEQWKNDMK